MAAVAFLSAAYHQTSSAAALSFARQHVCRTTSRTVSVRPASPCRRSSPRRGAEALRCRVEHRDGRPAQAGRRACRAASPPLTASLLTWTFSPAYVWAPSPPISRPKRRRARSTSTSSSATTGSSCSRTRRITRPSARRSWAPLPSSSPSSPGAASS